MVRNHMNTTVREEYEGMEYELWLYASEYREACCVLVEL